MKKLSVLSGIALLAGIIAFSACKKDSPPKGKQAADEFCDCISKTTEPAQVLCFLNWLDRYQDYIDFDFNTWC